MSITDSYCAGCSQRVVWIKTIAGKAMICNPEIITFSEGMKRVTLVTDQGQVIARPQVGNVGREPHWGTCPVARSFKKTKGE